MAILTIDQLISKNKKKMVKAVKSTMLQMSTEIINMSPVDTGAFRANWRPSTGTVDLTADKTYTNNDAQQRAENVLSNLEIPKSYFFTNSLPYASSLEGEEGPPSSQQAPNGMVRITVARFPSLFEQAVKAQR